MPRGYIDTQYIDFPENVDEAYLRGLELPSGLAFTDLAGELNAALSIVNRGVSPIVARMMAPPTTEATTEGGDANGMTVERRGQYVPGRPQFVTGSAHMLATGGVIIALGFTEKALKRITMPKFKRNTRALAKALNRGFRADLFYRFWSPAEIDIDAEAPTAATSPGFAGSGTGGNEFIDVFPDGSALPGSYTHFYREATANRAALAATILADADRWYDEPTFDLIGSSVAITAFMADTANFVPADSALVSAAPSAASARVDPTQFVGVYMGRIRVWHPLSDWTSDHWAIFKSFGDFNPDNPMVMRYDGVDGRDAYVETRESFPLANASAQWTYGINVNRRQAAWLVKIAASGNYAAPTIVG